MSGPTNNLQLSYLVYAKSKYFPTLFHVTKRSNSVYALDIHKTLEPPSLLSILGKSIEKMLTTAEEEYISRFTNLSPVDNNFKLDPEYFNYLQVSYFAH